MFPSPIPCFICVPGRAYFFAHQYKSRINIFSRSVLAGEPEKSFLLGPEPALSVAGRSVLWLDEGTVMALKLSVTHEIRVEGLRNTSFVCYCYTIQPSCCIHFCSGRFTIRLYNIPMGQ
jgi:hypothetical protein